MTHTAGDIHSTKLTQVSHKNKTKSSKNNLQEARFATIYYIKHPVLNEEATRIAKEIGKWQGVNSQLGLIRSPGPLRGRKGSGAPMSEKRPKSFFLHSFYLNHIKPFFL